jgi:effector-binding domain-containing protein
MLEAPVIIQAAAQAAAIIPIIIPRAQIQQVMDPAIQELLGRLAAQAIPPVGPVFAHHFRLDPDYFDFEVGVPVPTPVAPAGRVKPGFLPAATVAKTVYCGAYEGLAAAWGEFEAWLKAEGHIPASDLWECYVVGPESGPDPASWRTELVRPLIC